MFDSWLVAQGNQIIKAYISFIIKKVFNFIFIADKFNMALKS